MGNSYTTTFRAGFLLLVLVLLSSTSTSFPAAAAANYCGFTPISDPNYPGYVDYALRKVIYILLMNDKSGADYTYPILAENSASSAASCELNDMKKCNKCLNKLLPYVNQCSSYTSGSASYHNKCSLGFDLSA